MRVALADCEEIFRAQEKNKRMKDKTAHACRARARVAEELNATWRPGQQAGGENNALKALYLALAQQWLEIAIIGDAADQERAIQQLSDV